MSMRRTGWLTGHLMLVYAFLYGPILVLVALSFNESGLPGVWSGASLTWYGALWANGPLLQTLWNSFVVAFACTVISTVIGTLLALGMEAARRPVALEASVAAPLIIPDVVLAVALLSFYTMVGATLGLWSIVASHCVFNIAYVMVVVRARLAHFDRSIIEASIDLGAGPWRTLFRVILPVIAPGIIAAALIAFTLSFDEFIIAYFTAGAGPSSTTFPMKIYAMIRFGVTPEINAVATIVTGVTFVLVFIGQRLQARELVR
jgi:spermidine/putrescine transport system permease protein